MQFSSASRRKVGSSTLITIPCIWNSPLLPELSDIAQWIQNAGLASKSFTLDESGSANTKQWVGLKIGVTG